MKKYDIIIIGSGPAGVAAAKLISNKGMSVLILERGKDLNRRRDLTSGWFGHGLYSMNRLEIEDDVLKNPKAIRDAFRIVKTVSKDKIIVLRAKDKKVGKYCILPDSLGKDIAIYFFNSISKGGTISFNTNVEKITKDNDIFYVKTNRGTYASPKCLISTGKNSLEWIEEVCAKFNIKTIKNSMKIGVRVEVPTFKIIQTVSDAGDLKVECGETETSDARINAFVGEWEDSNILSAFGYGMPGKKSEKTNFMIGAEANEEVLRDVKIANVLANDKIQPERVQDFLEGRSLLEHIDAFHVLKESFKSLEKIFPAFSSYAIMYSPEIRLRGILDVDELMKTKVSGLYGAGECTARVSSLIGAMASGLVAGRTILKER